MSTFVRNDQLFQQNIEQFDFNIKFEQVFLSILPSALFIIAASWRTVSQARKPVLVNAPLFQIIKVAAMTSYTVLQLALLILAAAFGLFHISSIFIAASVLKLLSSISMIPLTTVEHNRSPRPSVLLTSYLLLSLLFDVTQVRTFYLSSATSAELSYSNLFTAAVALKTAILVLESRKKSKWMNWNEKDHSPEETSGILSLGVFFWLNKLFLDGYRKIILLDDLYSLDKSLDPEIIHEKFSRNMDYSRMKGPLLLPTIPRLGLLGFTLAQPLLIERLLDYLAEDTLNPNIGYGFIGASFFIYAGIALCWAFHRYYHHRMRTMLRSILVTETFIAATKARIGTSDDNAALTLMSTDIERIRMGFRQLHDIWASVLQVALSAWMLYSRVGVVFVAPIGVVIVCFICLVIVMNFIGNAQRDWMALVQKRVGLTAIIIASMKNLKISGLSSPVRQFVQKLRVEELIAGVRFRKIFIAAALFGFIPLLLSPALTFALTQNRLDASRIFTSLSFLTLLTMPLSQVFQSIPEVISALACIGRIQAFLECETRDDFRQVFADIKGNSGKALVESILPFESKVLIKNGIFGWQADKPVLRDVNIRIPKSSLTVVVGPVGSGKSTLCKALLGEIPFHEGRIILDAHIPHVGFCDQAAFLSNGSIKDNIIGFSSLDEERYAEVIDATALGFDFATLAEGDKTNVGSDGISLSGGQKQRVALARALYLQTDFLVLDDIFSGLDVDTEQQVFRKVFGTEGLLTRRRSTVVLCTHSARHLPAADYVIVLEDGIVSEQGTFNKLIANQGYLQRLGNVQEPTFEEIKTTIPTVNTTPNADASRQVGDRTVYKHYMMNMGWPVAASALFFATLWGFLLNFSTIWLTYWVDDINAEHPIGALISLFLLGASIWVVSIKRAGANLHQDILRTLFRATLRFFTETDTGVTTNLFSQDLNLIDTELPDATVSTLFSITQVIGQMARFYLRTSRQLRLLDLEAKSPLYTHFLDTVRGIATLRAFGFISSDVYKNFRLLTSSQRPSYLLLMIQEWLNLVLNVVVMLLAIALTTLAVRLHSNSAFAGAALYSLLSFGENLAGIVLFWTSLETSLGAIARLKTFNDTVKPEDRDGERIIPPERWPQRGVVELKGVSATYSTTRLALHNIHLTINSGEKVAICGRTGSGKSIIYGQLLQHLNRSELRQRIIAVPQETVFLPNGSTFQANLDVSEEATREECEAVLTVVGLWGFVQERGGLDAGMNASTFSAGQRQLMSLGRALIRRSIRQRKYAAGTEHGGILLLDEVSSSVDQETERVMQRTIKTEFKNYTVIAVAHRLDMVMDFDKVVVMDRGEIVETGIPAVLAGEAGSRFGDLVSAGNE
ncbi:ABC transporter domain-containing protein [Trichoderma breve]|uniref:ABC transporter domain-containing protein n=1 Tax=Trichoderma breve TaxID=2034170 RepID=A0A9W9BDR2_9HYPO|nr:ABC transporter domain-containing protein [Trichoderma breve]KAJ4857971.1 ABC transporter domain-containing protein [Trichoderma breve]